MTVEKGRYQVGLLWKGEERPDDNRNQALAVARHNLKRKLQDGTEDRKCYDEVLLAEYSQLDDIKLRKSQNPIHPAITCRTMPSFGKMPARQRQELFSTPRHLKSDRSL